LSPPTFDFSTHQLNSIDFQFTLSASLTNSFFDQMPSNHQTSLLRAISTLPVPLSLSLSLSLSLLFFDPSRPSNQSTDKSSFGVGAARVTSTLLHCPSAEHVPLSRLPHPLLPSSRSHSESPVAGQTGPSFVHITIHSFIHLLLSHHHHFVSSRFETDLMQ
jgi:hypothetical protein